MKDFRQLKVWEKAHGLTLSVYRASAAFPRDEQFGLTSQMRRSASSIATNLAEGCGRDGDAELARFSRYAAGSASELEYQLLLAHDLGYLDEPTFVARSREVVEVKRMLRTFIKRLGGNGNGSASEVSAPLNAES